MFIVGNSYTRDEIHQQVGGSIQSYLPSVNGAIVAGCFKKGPAWNPHAPNEVLPGKGIIIEASAKRFAQQSIFVPVFLKQGVNDWIYQGDYRVKHQSFDPQEILRKAREAGRIGEVSSILFLERRRL